MEFHSGPICHGKWLRSRWRGDTCHSSRPWSHLDRLPCLLPGDLHPVDGSSMNRLFRSPSRLLFVFIRQTRSVSGVQGDKWKRGGGVHWKLNSRESHRRPGPREKVANRLVVCFYCQRTTRGTGRDHPVDPPPRSRSSFIFLSAFIRRLTNINTRSWWNRHNCHDWSHSLKRVESGYPDLSIFLELAHDKT